MKIRIVVATGLALFAALFVVGHCTACFHEAAEVAAASSYEAQQMRCVDKYSKKADIDECRAKVKLAWSTVDGGGDQ